MMTGRLDPKNPDQVSGRVVGNGSKVVIWTGHQVQDMFREGRRIMTHSRTTPIGRRSASKGKPIKTESVLVGRREIHVDDEY